MYQPIVSFATGRVVALEALLRWDHPELGALTPDRFVPAAEASGAIVPIGQWVTRTALRDLTHFRDRMPEAALGVTINVAPAELASPRYAETLVSALAESGVPASALLLEITERTFLTDTQDERSAMAAVRDQGVRIALDDFGIGYSSLSYLSCLEVDVLKLDRAFTRDIGSNRRAIAMVEALVAMAGAFGMRTVAEGIETLEQLNQLRAAGCSLGQGYLIGRPVPAAAVLDVIRRVNAACI